MTSEQHINKLRHGAFFGILALLASNIGTGAIGLVVIALTTRQFSTEQYGIYGLFLALANLIVSLTVGWTRTGMFRFATESMAAGEDLGPTIGTSAVLSAVGLTLAATVLYIFKPEISNYVGLFSKTYWLILLYVLVLDFVTQIQYLLRAGGHLKTLSILPLAERFAFLGIFAFFCTQNRSWQARDLIAILLVSNSISIAIGTTCLGKVIFRNISFSPDLARKILRFSFPVLFSGIVLFLSNWLDVFFIKRHLDIQYVGIYYVGLQFLNLASQGILIINTVLTPILISLFKGSKRAETETFYRIFFPQTVMLGGVVILLISAAVRLLGPFLFGHNFQAAIPCILFLNAAVHSWMCYMLLYPYFFSTNQTLLISKMIAASLLVSVPLYPFVLDHFSLFGATFVRTFQTFILLFLAVYGCRRMIRLPRSVFAAILCVQCAIILMATLRSDRLFILVATGSFIGMTFALRHLGFCSPDSINRLRRLGLPARILIVLDKVSGIFHPSVAS